MTDTKKLIEEARKIAEQQKEQAIVEKAIEVSLLPADPVAPSNITPQEAFNGTWDAVKKVNEVKVNKNVDQIAIGNHAGETGQQFWAVAIGLNAGKENQGAGSFALGQGAGQTNQGTNSVAIGNSAGQTNQPQHSIVISALGTNKTPSAENEILLVAGTTELKANGTGITLNGNSIDDTSWKTSKQDTLTKTLTLHWDDGTTEEIKVG